MIADKISRAKLYAASPAFKKAFEFISKLKASSPCGETEISGRDIYANVFEYDTENTTPTFLEVHRKYIDIQYVISGSETLLWLPADGLAVKTPYDSEKDFEFLFIPADKAPAKLETPAGNFAVFFPNDGHFGKVACVSGTGHVKKVVVKVAVSAV